MICAHDVYTAVSVGGKLYDGSPQESGNIKEDIKVVSFEDIRI